MKLITIIAGFVIFSAIAFSLFGMTGSLGTTYGSTDAAKYTSLASEYQFYDNFSIQANSTLRNMESDTTEAGLSDEDSSTNFVVGALKATKRIGNVFSTGFHYINMVKNDSSSLIPKIVFDVAGILLGVVLILIVLHMIMRFKSET